MTSNARHYTGSILMAIVLIISAALTAQSAAAASKTSTSSSEAKIGENIGRALETKKKTYEKTISQGDISQISSKYTAFTGEISKTEAAFNKFKTKSVRDAVLKKYITPAKGVKERVVWFVSFYRSLQNIEALSKSSKSVEAESELEKLKRLEQNANAYLAQHPNAVPSKVTAALKEKKDQLIEEVTKGALSDEYLHKLFPQFDWGMTREEIRSKLEPEKIVCDVKPACAGGMLYYKPDSTSIIDLKQSNNILPFQFYHDRLTTITYYQSTDHQSGPKKDFQTIGSNYALLVSQMKSIYGNDVPIDDFESSITDFSKRNSWSKGTTSSEEVQTWAISSYPWSGMDIQSVTYSVLLRRGY